MLLFKNILVIFVGTNYLNIYRTHSDRTDLHEICRIGRSLAVDERFKVIFFDLSRGRRRHRDVAEPINRPVNNKLTCGEGDERVGCRQALPCI